MKEFKSASAYDTKGFHVVQSVPSKRVYQRKAEFQDLVRHFAACSEQFMGNTYDTDEEAKRVAHQVRNAMETDGLLNTMFVIKNGKSVYLIRGTRDEYNRRWKQ